MSNELYLRKEIEQQDAKDIEQDDILNDRATKWQVKILSSNRTTDGVIPDLTFNNLEIGKTYKLGGMIWHETEADDGGDLGIVNGAQEVAKTTYNPSAGGGTARVCIGLNEVFTAVATTLTFIGNSLSATHSIAGDGSRGETHVILEELPYHEETDQWD